MEDEFKHFLNRECHIYACSFPGEDGQILSITIPAVITSITERGVYYDDLSEDSQYDICFKTWDDITDICRLR